MRELESSLIELGMAGSPTLVKMKDGSWWCHTEVFSPVTGVKLKVQSESAGHLLPRHAAAECLERLRGIMPHANPSSHRIDIPKDAEIPGPFALEKEL